MMGAEFVGLVAAATIFVEGPPGSPESFNQLERDAVTVAIVKAEQTLGRLAQTFSPNQFLQCSFFNEFHSVVISPGFIAPPTNTTNSPAARDSEIETREQQWRQLAMDALGFPAPPGAPDSVAQFCDALLLKDWRVAQKPRHAIVIFVTKFPTGWMAYARTFAVGSGPDLGLSVGGNQATLQFDWIADMSGNFLNTGAGGHGLANLDSVAAHEIGHLFGGLDEYKDCNRSKKAGPSPGVPNDNCITNNPGSVPCLMKGNSKTLCPSTVKHFGWIDANGDGAVDAAPPRLTAITPNFGQVGDVIQITGEGLGETVSVVFTGIGAAEFTIVADTRLDVVVPAGAGSAIDVFLMSSLGISSPDPLVSTFTYL